jgi:hypothetical protein
MRGDKEASKQYHDERPKGRRQRCVLGNILTRSNYLRSDYYLTNSIHTRLVHQQPAPLVLRALIQSHVYEFHVD